MARIIRNEKQKGPFTVEDSSRQSNNPESEVWAKGRAECQQAGGVSELTAVFQRAEFEAAHAAAMAAENQVTSGQLQDPPTGMSQAPTRVRPDLLTDQPAKKRHGCFVGLIAALILTIVLATMTITCPNKQAHEDAIQEVTNEWVSDKVDEQISGITDNKVAKRIINKVAKDITAYGTEKIVSNFVDVDNYVVCSIGRVQTGANETKIVSLGVFGHVFTFDKDDIETAWKYALNNFKSRFKQPAP